jgi:hypothetical protein
MAKKKKTRYVRKEDFIVPLAYFHRYGFLVPLAFGALLFSRRLLVMAIGFLLYAAWTFIGYKCRWKHIFCSYQNAYHSKMTPNKIDWSKISKSDAYGVPIVLTVIGTIGVIASIFLE